MRIQIPKDAERIIEILNDNGFEAYVVGGCVRDSILGREPEDWDITTSAKPPEIKSLFTKTIDTGIQHGTVTVRMGGCSYETTTFRIDGVYEDNRHPKQVEFTSLLSEDLKRRDFTINAMAYSPKTGLVDIYNGMGDLENRIIRCVGNADERFDEDALRTLRAVRFAGQLDFTIEDKTYEAIRNAAENIENISVERIRVEITKLLMSHGADRMLAAYDTGLTDHFLPEWDRLVEDDKAEAALARVRYINDNYAGLPERDRRILCFAGLMVEMPDVAGILRRLKFDNYTIDMIKRIAKYYPVSLDVDRYNMKKIIGGAGYDAMEMIFIMKEAGAGCVDDEITKVRRLYEDIMENREPVYIKDLAVTGVDIMDVGIPAGKEVGRILEELLEEVLYEPEKNTKEYLIRRASEILY